MEPLASSPAWMRSYETTLKFGLPTTVKSKRRITTWSNSDGKPTSAAVPAPSFAIKYMLKLPTRRGSAEMAPVFGSMSKSPGSRPSPAGFKPGGGEACLSSSEGNGSASLEVGVGPQTSLKVTWSAVPLKFDNDAGTLGGPANSAFSSRSNVASHPDPGPTLSTVALLVGQLHALWRVNLG